MGVEQRLSLRKVFRTGAVLTVEDVPSIEVQTIDIARYGIGLVGIPAKMEKGQEGHLVFDLPVNGKSHNVDVRVHVAYCLPAGDVFRAGLEFLNVDPTNALLISYYVDVGD
jgi:hypothetical protein